MTRRWFLHLFGAALLCAATFLLTTVVVAGPGDDPETVITVRLAVQTALQQGRDNLLKGNYQTAVNILEAQISRIDGSREYLAVLRDAYRAYIRELQLAGKTDEAQTYLKRLRILDPTVVVEGNPPIAKATPPVAPTTPPPAPTKVVVAPRPTTARGKIDEEPIDPFHPSNSVRRQPSALWEKAELEFASRRYDAAGKLFEEAQRADPAGETTGGVRERWAYCKLYSVVQQLNSSTSVGSVELEREVRLALSMAPQLETYGKELLRKIEERRAPAVAKLDARIVVRHTGVQADGWAVAETTNYRVFHKQLTETAEQVAQAAEHTRTAMYRKWTGAVPEDWTPRCDVYLHSTAQDYSRATGVPANSPGHSTIRSEAGRVTGRRIDLHVDDAGMLLAVLPHEATHVVLAGQFGEHAVPRWADEGVAVLTEPRDRIERHLRTLSRHREDGVLFSSRQLMQLNDYPEPRLIGPFYAQSVSLVEFLTQEKDAATFVQFVRDGLRTGYESALQKHYGIQDFRDLDSRWQRFAFGQESVAARSPGR